MHRSTSGPKPGRVLQVLDTDRDTGERANVLPRRDPGVNRRGLRTRIVAIDSDECVHRVIAAVDPSERSVGDRYRGQISAADHGGERLDSDRSKVWNIKHGHRHYANHFELPEAVLKDWFISRRPLLSLHAAGDLPAL